MRNFPHFAQKKSPARAEQIFLKSVFAQVINPALNKPCFLFICEVRDVLPL